MTEKQEVKFDLRTKLMLILIVNLFLLLDHSLIFELVLVFGCLLIITIDGQAKSSFHFLIARYRPAFDAVHRWLLLYAGILYHSSIEEVFTLLYSGEMDFDENRSQ